MTINIRIDRSADWCEIEHAEDGKKTVLKRCHESELFEELDDLNLLMDVQVDWNASVTGPRL